LKRGESIKHTRRQRRDLVVLEPSAWHRMRQSRTRQSAHKHHKPHTNHKHQPHHASRSHASPCPINTATAPPHIIAMPSPIPPSQTHGSNYRKGETGHKAYTLRDNQAPARIASDWQARRCALCLPSAHILMCVQCGTQVIGTQPQHHKTVTPASMSSLVAMSKLTAKLTAK
jgi:hypothetical protein